MFHPRLNNPAMAFAILCSLCVGCNDRKSPPLPQDLVSESPESISSLVADFKFLDEVENNREDDGTVSDLQFVDSDGNTVRLDQFKGKKNVLLVFTRGFSGQLCPFCTTQTSRLIANYDQFTKRDAEVLLVYPGSKEQLPMFMQASIETSGSESFPFPVLLDEDLAAVNRLGIAAQLAFPSTFIIDKQNKVRLSYVGSNPVDRPSIKALLAQLDRLVE
jgi:peroxiredoxin